MLISLLASESSPPPEPIKFCRSDSPIPSVPSTVAIESLVLCSDGTKDASRSLVSSNVGFSGELGLPLKRGSGFTSWFEKKSAGVAGSDSIAEGAGEYEVNEGGAGGSSSKS